MKNYHSILMVFVFIAMITGLFIFITCKAGFMMAICLFILAIFMTAGTILFAIAIRKGMF